MKSTKFEQIPGDGEGLGSLAFCGPWGRKGSDMTERENNQVLFKLALLLWPSGNAGDTGNVGLIPGSGRLPGGGHGNPLQYSCLENPMDRGAWRAAVRGVAKSQTVV